MNAAKKTKSVPIVPPWLRQTVAVLFGPGRTVTLAVLVVAVFSGGAWAVWRHVEKHVESSRDYLVSVEQITITPPPEWVRSDVRAEAFRTASPPDRPAVESRRRPGAADSTWPSGSTPGLPRRRSRSVPAARVNVDIVYRRPVCMVEVANGSAVDLLPVDGEGVWLPGEDFSQKQKESYPCLAGIDRRPIQPVGHPWGDARVVDGASIAAALLPVWQQLKLYRIQAAAQAPSPGDRGPMYELLHASGHADRLGQCKRKHRRGRTIRGRKGRPARAVRGGPRKSRCRTVAGCPQDPAGRSGEAMSRTELIRDVHGSNRRTDLKSVLRSRTLGVGRRVTVRGGRRQFPPVVSSSRRMGRSSGASTPIRTMPGAMRTTVMEILSPIRIFSPGFRDKTSIRLRPVQAGDSSQNGLKGQSATPTHHYHDNPFDRSLQAPATSGKSRIANSPNNRWISFDSLMLSGGFWEQTLGLGILARIRQEFARVKLALTWVIENSDWGLEYRLAGRL